MGNVLATLRPSPPARFVYTSSTGVYGDYAGGWVDESSPRQALHPAGIRLIETEDLLFSAAEEYRFPAVITRLAGIYGPGRLPGEESLSRGEPLRGDPEGFLNLIHREDLIPSLMATALFGKVGDCYLLSDDHPALRRDYYALLASRLGIAPRELDWALPERPAASRRCRNQKMKEHFKIELKYPSYREGLAALLPVASDRAAPLGTPGDDEDDDQNQRLDQPSDHADADGAQRAPVIERLADRHDHRNQHPDRRP